MPLPPVPGSLAVAALRRLDPERAHNLTIRALKAGLGPKGRVDDPRLVCRVGGLVFPNPLGLAAGFDKNADVPDAMLRTGFGFVEVGAVTPRPQPGNDRPRVFRLPEDGAVINRYGFNNDGLEAIAARLAARQGQGGIVGINLGANKDSEDRATDYVTGLAALEHLVDFCTVNISSPNTPGLRALQDKDSLTALLRAVLCARQTTTPVFLKIAPDLTDEDKTDIISVVKETGIDGLIVSNTTISRPDTLLNAHKAETGGLSGRPLFRPSTDLLAEIARELDGAVPLIGVGGVAGADEAWVKITHGASLVQLYTALIYRGVGLVPEILNGLRDRLTSEGFDSIEDAVGAAL